MDDFSLNMESTQMGRDRWRDPVNERGQSGVEGIALNLPPGVLLYMTPRDKMPMRNVQETEIHQTERYGARLLTRR